MDDHVEGYSDWKSGSSTQQVLTTPRTWKDMSLVGFILCTFMTYLTGIATGWFTSSDPVGYRLCGWRETFKDRLGLA